MTNTLRVAVVFVLCLYSAEVIHAQQAHVTTPLVNAQDSYYENFGVNWGYRSNNPNGFFFNFGSPNSTAPAFGGFDPSTQARFGFGTSGGAGSFNFNFTAGQGNTRSVIASAPSVTLQNGVPGSVQDVSVRPFVTSFTPVVGGRTVGAPSGPVGASVFPPMVNGPYATRPVLTSPLADRLSRLRQEAATKQPGAAPSNQELLLGAGRRNASRQPSRAASSTVRSRTSSAARGDISLAEIRRQQQAQPRKASHSELQELIDTARAAEAGGHLGAARIRYRKAAAKATGQLKADLLAKLESLAK